MVDTPPQLRWIDTIVLWLLGSALFITITFVPAVLLAVFYGGLFVHGVVLTACAVIFLLLWLTSIFRPPESRPSSP